MEKSQKVKKYFYNSCLNYFYEIVLIFRRLNPEIRLLYIVKLSWDEKTTIFQKIFRRFVSFNF